MQPWFCLGSRWWLAVGVGALCLGYHKELWGIICCNSTASNPPEEQWVSVGDAINHMVREYDSYQQIGARELVVKRAFQDLYELMCTGEARVQGALLREPKKARRIPPKLCRKLKPTISESVSGSVYSLMDPNPSPPAEKVVTKYGEGEVRWHGQGIYDDLRVNKRDLYKHWPKKSKP